MTGPDFRDWRARWSSNPHGEVDTSGIHAAEVWLARGASDVPRRHAFDGGRSRAVRQRLEPMLEQVRGLLGADVAVALHSASRGRVAVLASAGDERQDLPLVNEDVHCTDALDRPLFVSGPCLAQDIQLRSRQRPYRLELSSALLIPWIDGSGRALLVLGVVPGRWLDAGLETAELYGHQLQAVHHEAAYRGTVRLAEDLAAACRAVDRAEFEATESGELLAGIASIARSLMGTSAAYIALPDPSTDRFPFATLAGIRTSAFRRLRMAHDQGIGGLARCERATVHTLDYAHDSRLRSAPFRETAGEGIVSAMCTPLIIDGAIQGTLYLGDRHPRAFSRTDTELLDEFGRHVSLRLSRQHIEDHRISVLRHRERERLASMLHDSVVRSLVEIGFHAEQGRLSTEDHALRSLLSEIGAAAGATLDTLRGELASLSDTASSDRDPCVGEVVEALRLVPRRPGVSRTFELTGVTHDSAIPERLLDALISVGEEALTNAELHSLCTSEQVTIEQTETQIRLRVTDNGRGIDGATASSAIDSASGHLGLRTMRRTTRRLGGYTRIDDGPGGSGTEVVAVFPLAEHQQTP